MLTIPFQTSSMSIYKHTLNVSWKCCEDKAQRTLNGGISGNSVKEMIAGQLSHNPQNIHSNLYI